MKFLSCVLALSALLSFSCSSESSGSQSSIRLVDLLDSGAFESAAGSESAVEPEGLIPLATWRVGQGVADLEVREGKLHGRATSSHPIIYAPLPVWADPSGTVDSVELGIEITSGSEISGTIEGGDQADVALAVYNAEHGELFLRSEVVAKLGKQTVRMPFGSTQSLAGAKFLHVSPTNEAGAEFEIETARLVTTKERLASTPSGVNWQGLADIFRESIVSHSPQSFRIDVTVPAGAWLDVNLGALDDRPVTFEISGVSSGGTLEPVLRQTITTPNRWEPFAVDLKQYAGQRVTLDFALSAGNDNEIGLWGNPIIRVDRDVPAASSRAPRNVIFIQADTLRRDHLPFYGYERDTAPTLARMVSEGVLFTDNVSPGSWTKVATPAIMTSLYPTTNTVAEFSDRLPASATTIAELYRQAGYATLSYCSVMFTGKFSNLHQGYDELHEFGSLPEQGPKTGREYVDRLTSWIDRHPNTPFFAYLQAFDPHSPYEPRRPYNTQWADPAGRDKHLGQLAKLKPFVKRSFMYQQQLANSKEMAAAGVDPEPFFNYHKDWYDGSIRGMDAEIGRLLENLKRNGLLESTLIVFFSDHGEEFQEHGGVFHGQSVYGELTNVPLFFYWPAGLPSGVVIPETVRSIDIMPTVIELSGLPAPAEMQGQSLMPLINKSTDGEWRPQPAISENVTSKSGDLLATAISSGEWRLIHNTVIPNADRPEYELFDRRADPLNLQNIAAEHADVVERMKQELEQWRESAVAAKLSAEDSTADMTPQEIEKLKSLGYLQ